MKGSLWFWVGFFSGSLLFAAEWGWMEPGPYPGTRSPGPEKQSKRYVVTAPVTGGQAEVNLPLTAPKGAIVVVVGDQPSRAVIAEQDLKRKPFRELELERMDLPPEGVRLEVANLAAGEHSLRLEGLRKRSVQIVVAEPESPLQLSLQVQPLAVRSGEPVVVRARLEDEHPVAAAEVQARLSNGENLILRDDGQGSDEKARDGVYTASFLAPTVSGMRPLELYVEARGRRGNQLPFARVATAATMVTKPQSGFAQGEIGVEPDRLEVKLLPARGRFRLEAIFAFGDVSFAWAQEDFSLEGVARAVALPRPEDTWGAEKVLLRLLNLDTFGVEAEQELALDPLAAPPDLQRLSREKVSLPPSKAEAARRFEEESP